MCFPRIANNNVPLQKANVPLRIHLPCTRVRLTPHVGIASNLHFNFHVNPWLDKKLEDNHERQHQEHKIDPNGWLK